MTEKIRRKPYSVVLFDEIEKAHPDVLNILLQILDDGRVTDASGRTVNFENTIIVMTSNAGSQKRDNIMGFSKTVADSNREKAIKALEEFLRPEFIARVDEIIAFSDLDEKSLEKIAALMLSDLSKVMEEKGIELKISSAVYKLLASMSVGAKSGARELRNNIRKLVEDAIVDRIIACGETKISKLSLTAKDGKIFIS